MTRPLHLALTALALCMAALAAPLRSAGAQGADADEYAWLAGRWQILYTDAQLGDVRGSACVFPGIAPSQELDPELVQVRLQDPETYDVFWLYGRALSLEGDELVLELGGKSPSKVRRTERPALFSRLRREGDLTADLSNVVRAPVGGELTLRLGETTQRIPVDPGVRAPVAADVTLRLRVFPDRRTLQGSWTTDFDARDGMGGRRAGTRDGARVTGEEAWVKDTEPVRDVRVRQLDYRSNRARSFSDGSARARVQRFPGLTTGTVELEVPVQATGHVQVWIQDELILLESAAPVDQGVSVVAILSEDVLPGRKLLSVDGVPVEWSFELPDRALDPEQHPACADFLADHRCGRKRAPEASFQRFLYEGTVPPPASWQATEVLAAGELFRIWVTQPREPFYRRRSFHVRTPHATYGPFVAERSEEHPNVLAPDVFFHAGLLPEDALDRPANFVPIDVRPGEEVHVIPTDVPEDEREPWGRLPLLAPNAPGWNDTLRRAAGLNEGVDPDEVLLEWDQLRASFRPQQRTGAIVGAKSNWIFTNWLFALGEKPLLLLDPVGVFLVEDAPEVTRTLPVTLADHAALLRVHEELERILVLTEARLQDLRRRVRADPDAGLELLSAEFPVALANGTTLYGNEEVPARIETLIESVQTALEDVREVDLTDLDGLLEVSALATPEVLQRAASRLVRQTDPTRGEPAIPALIPDRQARSVVLSLDALCRAAREQGEYASLDTSVCLSLASVATAGVSVFGRTVAFVGEVLVAAESAEAGIAVFQGGNAVRVLGSYAGFLADAGSVFNDGLTLAQMQGSADLLYGVGVATGDFDAYWANRRARTLQVFVGAPSFVGFVSQSIGLLRNGLPRFFPPDSALPSPGRTAQWTASKIQRLRRSVRSLRSSSRSVRAAAGQLDGASARLGVAARQLADEIEREIARLGQAADDLSVLGDAERLLVQQRVLTSELEQLADELTLRGSVGRDLAQRRALLARRDLELANAYADHLAGRLGLARESGSVGAVGRKPPGDPPSLSASSEGAIADALEELAATTADETLALRARGQAEWHAAQSEPGLGEIPTGLDPQVEREIAAWLRSVAPLLESPEEMRYALEGARWYERHAALALAGTEDLPSAPPALLPELLREQAALAGAELNTLDVGLGVRCAELESGWQQLETASTHLSGSAQTPAIEVEPRGVDARLDELRAEVEDLRAQVEAAAAPATSELARASSDLQLEPAFDQAQRVSLDDPRLRGYRSDLDLGPSPPLRLPPDVAPADPAPVPWFEAEASPGLGSSGAETATSLRAPDTQALSGELETSAATLAPQGSPTETRLSVPVEKILEDLATEQAALLPAPQVEELPRPGVAPIVKTSFGRTTARWPRTAEGLPIVMLENLGHRIEISDVFRRGLPPGCGGVMISDTLCAIGEFAPRRLRMTNILPEQPTLQQLASGVAPADTVLGRALRNTVQDLGGYPVQWNHGVWRGKPWLEVEIDY